MKIGFIGIGNMGGAILQGYRNQAKEENHDILIFDLNKEKTLKMAQDLEVEFCQGQKELVKKSDVIILAVKPYNFEELLEEIKNDIKEDSLIISIAAGVSIRYIRKNIGEKGKIVRVMPNLPALINQGVTSISREENISEAMFEVAKNIFEGIGKVFEVPEDMIHTVIGVSGSSPAYTCMYIDALARSAEKRGMKREEALEFAAYSVAGAARTVIETKVDPDELKKQVCSPNGTTIAAVNKLEELDLYEVIDKGFEEAYKRSKEITK